MPKTPGHSWRLAARALAAGAALALACPGLAGCAGPPPAASPALSPAAEDAGKPVVLATFSVIADLVREVGGDRVEVVSITKPGAEIHGYEPTPSDLAKIHEADLVLDNGLGLERWFERFVRGLDVPHAVLSEGVEPEPIAAGAYTGKANPHAWMSPVQARVYVSNAEKALAALSPADAEYFAQRAADMSAKLEKLEAQARERLARHPGAALVTCEGAFSYLARDLGLREHYLWPVNADAEGTPRQIRDQIAFVREHAVPVVYCESTVNDGAQRRVAEATGARLAGPLYVDSISGPEGPVPTFLDLVAYDLDLILKGLPQ
ncbi:metal ABC transporter substrate-binding protein [Zafaria cholistanensis]|uniref:Metal ABC transporter substrate-binding protein n=1 Tax=Zafaria cholistanensis TaxID=1682741 RepID=A0A5A7NTC6_9MICC|nr:metal ABC transporter substrate-binding protein [Zafaria cholistanensis]GER24043.1 metal ABC transporter substrate-binding protein [Zafaria cholistanensis]